FPAKTFDRTKQARTPALPGLSLFQGVATRHVRLLKFAQFAQFCPFCWMPLEEASGFGFLPA
ncbi:MAG: hypothetical protein ACREAB_06735, partial [Blastocatellia bacterium]